MKKLLLFAVMLTFSVTAISQELPYFDDFESYPVGSYIGVENPTWWEPWGGVPGAGDDAMVSDDYAFSGTKSLIVSEDGGATDLIWKLGDKTSGIYEVNFRMYVPSGYGAYYNIQHFQAPGTEWAMECYFKSDGTGYLHAEIQNAATFNFPFDTWFPVVNYINLTDDEAKLYVNDVLVHTWQFSTQSGGGAGTNQLGGVDFYAGADGTDVPLYYFDDADYHIVPNYLYEDDFESYPAGSYISVENPTWWLPWGGVPGGSDDAMVSDDYAQSGTKSIIVSEDGGATDCILKLGDKTAGTYEVNWYMYVPFGYGGYYNIQHFEAPGTEWAMECYFKSDGTGYLHAEIQNAATFDFPFDTWFPIVNHIDLDQDIAELYINDVMVHTWQFSTQSGGGAGTKQLGGIDFYAGADGTDTPVYYFDDLEYIEFVGQLDPVIGVTPVFFNVYTESGTSTTETMTIANTGAADLEYEILVIYNIGDDKDVNLNLEAAPVYVKTLSHNSTSAAPTLKGNGSAPSNTDDEVILNYDDDDVSNAIGWNTVPVTVQAAAMFPAEMTLPYAGMYLTSVDIYVNDPSSAYFLKIYDMGTWYAPGDLLHIQSISPTPYAWNTITLTDPVPITGADLWVAWQFTQTDLVYTAGCDAGTNLNFNGDWLSTGVGWSHLSDNPALPYNWHIRAKVTGDPITQWLSTDPVSGIVVPEDSQDITVTFDASELPEGLYTATLKVLSNDPANPEVNVPVAFHVEASAFAPPTDLEAVVDCQDVVLSWVEPSGVTGLLGYNIYRDDVMINASPVTETTYTDEALEPGTYSYKVTAAYDGGESLPAGPVEATIMALTPISDLVLFNEMGTPDVFLTWSAPGATWLHWDDGVNYDGIGLTNGGTFLVAGRFGPDDLGDYNGMYLTKMAIFPRGYNTNYTLKVWTGADAGTLVSEQAITPVIEEWNTFDLSTPVMIDASDELWIGYECGDQPAGDYPAGCDAGPAVAGWGDMISMDGATWDPLSSFGLDYNWNIQGWVQYMDAVIPIMPIINNSASYSNRGELSQGTLKPAPHPAFQTTGRPFMGYNVYRNEELLTLDPIIETLFEDLDLANGYYNYCVTAVYGENCESEPVCADVDIVVGIDETGNSYVIIYPNPAHGYVNLEFNTEIHAITIMNFTGQVVYYSNQVDTNEIVKINTSSLNAGVYFVQVKTSDGTVTKKITIQ